MRKLVLLLAAVVAMSLTGLAQTSSQGTSSGTATQSTTTTTQKQAKPAKGEAAASTKESQLTGCLAKDASGSGFMLTNGHYKKGVEVKSSEDLSAHVGHEVKLMGTWEQPTAGEAGGAGTKGTTMKTFNATKINHISDTCKTSGGATKSKTAAPSGY